MKIENKVFGKLFQEEKLELESSKYEFAGRDLSQIDGDVEKVLTNFSKVKNSVQEKLIDYRLSYKTYEKQLQGLKSDALALEGDLENVASALASMGVPGDAVEGFQKAKSKVNILMKAIDEGESNLIFYKNPIK
jgi:hypothetical protein